MKTNRPISRRGTPIDRPQVGVLLIRVGDRLATYIGHATGVHRRRAGIVEDGVCHEREHMVALDELGHTPAVTGTSGSVIAHLQVHLAPVHPATRIQRSDEGPCPIHRAAERLSTQGTGGRHHQPERDGGGAHPHVARLPRCRRRSDPGRCRCERLSRKPSATSTRTQHAHHYPRGSAMWVLGHHLESTLVPHPSPGPNGRAHQ